ncbi:MAG: TonB-dependent receptor [Acidobacteriota bacterium]
MQVSKLVLLLLPAIAAAQESRGSILGRVTDPSGAAVTGASVEVQNVDTNTSLKTSSNEAGNYQIPFLLPGNYTVRVEQTGFKKLERQGIRVSTNEAVTLNISLELGALTESVTVTAAPPLLNTANADLGQVIDKTYVGMVSVSLSRNIINMRSLAPGVTGGTGTYTSSAQADFSIAGGGGTRGDNEIVVDGLPNTSVSGTIGFIPSLDSVEEVKVHTTMFDAAYGHSNGGAVTITTRGGTNQPHGALYLYKRWNNLYANSWTNNRLGLPKPPVQYQQWGYTVSGPVWLPGLYNGRDRTFFSTSLERDHDPRELTRQARVPTEAERQGDFSRTLNRLGGPFSIYDPATTTRVGATATRQPFAGARIPASRLSPIGQAVLSKYPLPTLSVAPQLAAFNWGKSTTYTVDQRQWSARIDHVLTDRQRLFGRVGLLDRIQAADDPFPGVTSFPIDGGSDLGRLFRRRINAGLDDTVVFSPSLVASFRMGLLSYASDSTGGARGSDPKELQMPDVVVRNQAYRGWPNFVLGENIPDLGSSYSFSRDMIVSLVSTWTKLAGRHAAKFGIDYRLGRIHNVSPGGNAVGTFNFNPVFTQADPFTPRSADTSGSAMASLLLAAAASGSFGFNSPTSVQNHYAGLFAQDDWKVTSRLTLNLGVRYEMETPLTERYNRMSYRFDESAALPVKVPGLDLRGGILFAGGAPSGPGNPRRTRIDRNNFGPRIGFAFSATPRTVIRAGWGVFYSLISMNTSFFGSLGVFNAVTPYVGTIDNGATPFTTLADPFPAGLRAPEGSAVGLMAQVGDSLSLFDDRRVSPYNHQWQLSLQRELPARTLLEVAYVGMHSLKQVESFNLNEKPDRYLALGAAENTRVTNPFLGVFQPTSSLGQGSTITQNRLWARFPQFTSLTIQGANTGRALYHSLQVKADKRLTNGLNVLWTYTFSRLMDNNTTSIVNPRFYRAVSPLDQKRVSRVAFAYQLPFRFEGPGLNRLWRQVAGGWALGGLAQFASGTPLSVSHSFGRPIRIRNPRLSGPVDSRLGDQRDASRRVSNPYFDINAFAPLPDQYTITPEPPALDELRSPGLRSLNLSLFKTFPLVERYKLEVRMEGTGVTNTPNFSAPGTNMSQAATFGVISSAGGNRTMQASARLVF